MINVGGVGPQMIRKCVWSHRNSFLLFFLIDPSLTKLKPTSTVMCVMVDMIRSDFYRWGDINVYQQRQGTHLLICLNQTTALSNGFLLLYEMLWEFQKHGPWTNHDVCIHCRAKKNGNRNRTGHPIYKMYHTSPEAIFDIWQYTNNECLWVQWYKYFHEVKDEMFHSTRRSRVEWNISSFTEWKYLFHCMNEKNIHYLFYITAK